ncbi:hypothetical protein Taro_053467 [Colocasia esculenta]|uniref:Uncharacterized protein n=1 Tax=Colocasia esculenta TaxID=4460 RepID=A0A843XL31_COLES|nr:hypothetical protein [Colocasia esculenta]
MARCPARLELEKRNHPLHSPFPSLAPVLSLGKWRTWRAVPSYCCCYLLLLAAVWRCTTRRSGTTSVGGVIVIADHPLCGYR